RPPALGRPGRTRRRARARHRALLLLHVAPGLLRHDDDRVARVGALLPADRAVGARPAAAADRILSLRGGGARHQGPGGPDGPAGGARAGAGRGRLAPRAPVAPPAGRDRHPRAREPAVAPALSHADRAELRGRRRGRPLRRLVLPREDRLAAPGAAGQPGAVPPVDALRARRPLVVVARPRSAPAGPPGVDRGHRGGGEPVRRAADPLLPAGAAAAVAAGRG